MSNDDAFDDRYVRFREHADVRERVTALEGGQTQVLNMLSRIETTLNAKTPAAPTADSSSLALHHVADAMKALAASQTQRPNVAAEVLHALNTSKAGQPGRVVWALVGALLVIVALMGWRSLTGG